MNWEVSPSPAAANQTGSCDRGDRRPDLYHIDKGQVSLHAVKGPTPLKRRLLDGNPESINGPELTFISDTSLTFVWKQLQKVSLFAYLLHLAGMACNTSIRLYEYKLNTQTHLFLLDGCGPSNLPANQKLKSLSSLFDLTLASSLGKQRMDMKKLT